MKILNDTFLNYFKKNVFLIVFIFSLTWIYSNINLHYLSIHAPDYQWYKDYFDYFFDYLPTTRREQGLLYFYLVSLNIKLTVNQFGSGILEQLISNSIQSTNLVLYIFGLIGLRKLLILKGFNNEQVYLSFTVINFFPQTTNLLVTMKPEIFAFSVLTWIFYFFENYLKTSKNIYLYLCCLPSVLLINSKATILGMVGLIFLYLIVINKREILNLKFFKGFYFINNTSCTSCS